MEQLLQDSLNELHYEQECEKKQSLQCSPRVDSSSSSERMPSLGGWACMYTSMHAACGCHSIAVEQWTGVMMTMGHRLHRHAIVIFDWLLYNNLHRLTHVISPHLPSRPSLEFHEIFGFETFRSERLADMNMTWVIDTYIQELDTVVIKLGR
jgi:hypothetical protein